MKPEKILIAMPAYNEEKMITQAIINVLAAGYHDVLVIDDGSTDKTVETVTKMGIKIISHFKNCGLGVAIRTALRYAKQHDYAIMVTFDSDAQHVASDIAKVIAPIVEQKTDVVVGTRNLNNGNIPKLRRVILRLSNIYTWLLFGVLSHDSQSGFRAFSRRAIELFKLNSERMEVSSEIFAEMKKHDLKYAEVPIAVIYSKYSLSKGQKNSNLFSVGFKLFLRLFK
jgi:glycosyltransferase involved in cell wall biosynthesis